jgi:hypothetical protein
MDFFALSVAAVGDQLTILGLLQKNTQRDWRSQ